MQTILEDKELSAGGSYLDDLLPALERLDLLIERALIAARVAYGPAAATDPFRGLHIGQEDVERLLTRQPGAPLLHADEEAGDPGLHKLIEETSRLAWLKQVFNLSSFDVDLIMIALAPELDLRYERLYAYLQDDVSRKRPSVDLVLNLLCPSAAEKLTRRAHFGSDAPLICHGLVRLVADPNQVRPPLLSHYLKLDEQIIALLLGEESLDTRLAHFCRMVTPTVRMDELTLANEAKATLPTLVQQAREARQPLRLYFQGPPGAGRCRTAEALAGEIGALLLVVDLGQALVIESDFVETLRLVFREAWFRDAVLYIEGVDELRVNGRAAQLRQLIDALVQDAGITILSGALGFIHSGPKPTGVITVPFSIPDFRGRRHCWLANLDTEGVKLEANAIDALADRFRLTPEQIAEAVVAARNKARWDMAGLADNSRVQPDVLLTAGDLFTAARAQSGQDLAALAHKIEPIYTWDDIVLPADTLAQLTEMCQRVAHRQRVLGEWGFDRKLSLGKGVNALFAGPSGTGKTMAAEIIANELSLDLYKIDLAGVVSKYIGETEKNLDRIFTTAENANAILFFDEADALFGKRSEVRDSHDRYANIEISYLLQKMEQYEGIAILASNLRQNLDNAFVRRLAFVIHFPFPDESHRLQIWTRIWPAAVPLASDVEVEFLANQFKLSGGNIKNIALASAFLASGDGGVVTMDHLRHATQREYQKLGKVLSNMELHGASNEVAQRVEPGP